MKRQPAEKTNSSAQTQVLIAICDSLCDVNDFPEIATLCLADYSLPATTTARYHGPNRSPRKSKLLRVQWAPESGLPAGYADLHSWPELGEAELSSIIQALAERLASKSESLSNALLVEHNAAELVQERLRAALAWSLFEKKPKALVQDVATNTCNHLLVDADQGASGPCAFKGAQLGARLKLKCGPETEARGVAQSMALWPGSKWRLDFNGSFTADSLTVWLEDLGTDALACIEVIEDPMLAPEKQKTAWEALSQRFAIPLATDWLPAPDGCTADYLVIKSSRDFPPRLLEQAAANMSRVYFTHSMGHPISLIYDLLWLRWAEELHPLLLEDCGLMPSPAQTKILEEIGAKELFFVDTERRLSLNFSLWPTLCSSLNALAWQDLALCNPADGFTKGMRSS